MAVGVVVIAGWIGITVWLYRNPLDPLNPPLFDWTDGPFGGFFVLTLIFGMNLVAVSRSFPLHRICCRLHRSRLLYQYQVTAQWILATFTNNPEELARLAGLAKGVLAGGIATSFGTEAAGLPQLKVVAYNFSLQAIGLVCMAFVAWKCVTVTNYSIGDSEEPTGEVRETEKA